MIDLVTQHPAGLPTEAYFKQLPHNGWDSVLCALEEHHRPFEAGRKSKTFFIVFTLQLYFESKFLCPSEIYLWIS